MAHRSFWAWARSDPGYGAGFQFLVRADDLLGHVHQVGDRAAPVRAVRAFPRDVLALHPDRQVAGDGQHRHAGLWLVDPDQAAADAALGEHGLQLVDRLPGGDQRAVRPYCVAGRGQPQREPDHLARDLPAAEPGPGGVVAPLAGRQAVDDLEPAAVGRVELVRLGVRDLAGLPPLLR